MFSDVYCVLCWGISAQRVSLKGSKGPNKICRQLNSKGPFHDPVLISNTCLLSLIPILLFYYEDANNNLKRKNILTENKRGETSKQT